MMNSINHSRVLLLWWILGGWKPTSVVT